MGTVFSCCASEAQQVANAMKKLSATPASQAKPGPVQLCGRVVMAGTYPFYAPADGKPCCYWRVILEEQKISTGTDSDGKAREDYHWETLVDTERFVDFYIQDGNTKVFVSGKSRTGLRVQSNMDVKGQDRLSIFGCEAVPPGVRALLAEVKPKYVFGSSTYSTGKYRFKQCSFDVNEQVSAVGILGAPSKDPYGQDVATLGPISKEDIDKLFPADHADAKAWAAVKKSVSKGAAVLVSDDPKSMPGITVPEVQGLPTWMTAKFDPSKPPAAPPQAGTTGNSVLV